MSDQSTVRPVATRFAALLYRYRTAGFIDLVRPATFEEQCAEQRLLRDAQAIPLDGRVGRTGINRKTAACLETIRRLHAEGWSQREIAEEVGLSMETVMQYVPTVTCAEAMRRKHMRRKKNRVVVPLPPWIRKKAANR